MPTRAATTTAAATTVTTAERPTSTTAADTSVSTTQRPVSTTAADTTVTTAAGPVSTTAALSTTTVPREPTTLDTGDVNGFDVVVAHLAGRALLLAVADTEDRQRRGLMGVESMGDLDGMVFVWDDPRPVSFWMKDTLIALQVGFFDAEGTLFRVSSMTPCLADPCPTYPSDAPTRYALEARPGFFDEVPLGESLTLGETVVWS